MKISLRATPLRVLILALPGAAPAAGQWDPPNGQWGKSDPADLRVMTWNIEDGVCSTADKSEGFNSWTALARIVAAMRPDVLLMQEAGDNSGNGTGSGGDSVADLTVAVDLFLHGGIDPFRPGNPQVTSWVQKYAVGYDLPFVFVSSVTDNFNRNVLLSRYPFADLNGDTRSQLSDIPLLLPDLYAPGGNGGIRGFQFAEIDLPDAVYDGDLVLGGAHLKAGSSSSDLAERLRASQNVAYVIDYWFNGAGTGIPDPRNRIQESPPATSILDESTPVVIGGDWNEDEQTNGRRGPADWLTQAQFAGSTDGTDRDRTDATFDSAVHFFTGSRATFGSSTKLDYLAWQDSIAVLRRAFVFNTSGTPTGALPPELNGFPFPSGASTTASDHRPVIADLILPPAPDLPGDLDGDGDVDLSDFTVFQLCFGGSSNPPAPTCPPGVDADLDGDGDVDLADFIIFQQNFTGSL